MSKLTLKEFFTRQWTRISFVLVSLWVTIAARHIWDSYNVARFADMIHGTAWRPYVNRSFVPFLIRSMESLLPSGFEAWLLGLLERYPFLAAAHSYDTFKVERSIYLLINIAALTMFAFALRRLMRFAGLPERWSTISVLVAIGSMPAYVTYVTYIYDGMALALFTWSLVFLSKEKWTAYLLTFALCIWNKETAVLLAWIFLLLYWKELRTGSMKHWVLLASQGLMTILILGAIRYTFSDNPGSQMEWHLFHRKIILFVYTFQGYATLLLLIFLLAYEYKKQRPLFRVGVTVLPILIGSTFFFGMLDEYRDYYEALPIVATMVSVSLYNIARRTQLVEAT
ncbi:MAG: hypothetical protein Q8922_14770 [Bacteroidota bacterium]|nr:hypothetical protein [Bacteroidota bacterium]MDP4234540.1 hypothetical protein [Bacteroidota bacterium]MDP4242605.1 hypothetical protein [Bacteroidota bacterium]MDP4289181.1 hypothetical protein [Bacteroidota bacterium]